MPGLQRTQPPEAEHWDRLLLDWPRAHVLQSHGMGTVQAAMGWTPRRVEVAISGRPPLPVLALEGAPAGPLPRRLYVPRGPACAAADATAWAAALEAIERVAAMRNVAVVEIEPAEGAMAAKQLSDRLGSAWTPVASTRQPLHTAVVDLTGGVDAVLARMRPKGRYNVRLARRRGVTCACIEDPGEAGAVLGPLLGATAVRQGTHLADGPHVRRVLTAIPTAEALVARVDGEAVAGLVLVTFGREAIYLYGGSSERHRERQPSAALQAFAMERAAQAGCVTYDLWGMPPDHAPAHPWHGLRQFKLNLGGVEYRSAGTFVRVRRPAAARALWAGDALRDRLRRVRGRL